MLSAILFPLRRFPIFFFVLCDLTGNSLHNELMLDIPLRKQKSRLIPLLVPYLVELRKLYIEIILRNSHLSSGALR
jgi:hypothetical protein